MKDHCGDNAKASRAPVSTSTQDFKPSNKAKKDKKKKQYKDKQDSKDSKNSINPAIEVSMAEVGDKKKRKKDISEITYYNCNKKEYFPTKCPESWKS